MIRVDVGRVVAVASIPLALAFNALWLTQIYVVSFVEETLFVFFNLAEITALSRVVPAAQFPQATAQNEAAFGVANIVGPSFGTFLFQSIGRGAPFFVGSSSGFVYGVDAATGAQVWRQSLGAPVPGGGAAYSMMPLLGPSAGDGLLVVAAGNTLTAFRLSTNP